MTERQSHTEPNQNLSEKDRVDQARSRLMRLTAPRDLPESSSQWTPAWSSAVLEDTVAEILSPPGSRISDVFRGMWSLLSQTQAPLTRTMANFIRDVVVLCFTGYRSRYDQENFEWMAALLKGDCTEAQAYLALYAMPDISKSEYRKVVLEALLATDFAREAQRLLSEQSEHDDRT